MKRLIFFLFLNIVFFLFWGNNFLYSFPTPVSDIYFTFQDDIQKKFIDFLDSATYSIKLAIYDLDLKDVADELIKKHNLGYTVEVVIDYSHYNEEQVERLRDAGIPVIRGESSRLMHNKFCVVDFDKVWVGSWNATYNGTYLNNNNVIVLNNLTLGENFITEFDEMFKDSLFGPDSPPNTPVPVLNFPNLEIDTYFAPEDEVMEKIVTEVDKAQSSIHFMAFSFTHYDLKTAMVNAMNRGVEVKGIMETSQAQNPDTTAFDELQKAGIDVQLDGNPFNMHDKVIIIDGKTVITGSFNFSKSADEKNDESLIMLKGTTTDGIASLYEEEFQRIWNEAMGKVSAWGHLSISGEVNSYVSGAKVSLVGESIEAISNENGWYYFTNLKFLAYPFTMRVEHPDFFAREVFLSSSSPKVDVKMREISSYGSITGKILDKDGNPLFGANVEVIHRKYTDNVLTYFKAFTDQDGRYFFPKIPATDVIPQGEIKVIFTKKGYEKVEMENIPVTTGASIELEDVRLGRVFQTAAITNPILPGYVSVVVYAPYGNVTKTPKIEILQQNYIPREVENVVEVSSHMWAGAYKIVAGYGGEAKIIVNDGEAVQNFYIRELKPREETEITFGEKASLKVVAQKTGYFYFSPLSPTLFSHYFSSQKSSDKSSYKQKLKVEKVYSVGASLTKKMWRGKLLFSQLLTGEGFYFWNGQEAVYLKKEKEKGQFEILLEKAGIYLLAKDEGKPIFKIGDDNKWIVLDRESGIDENRSYLEGEGKKYYLSQYSLEELSRIFSQKFKKAKLVLEDRAHNKSVKMLEQQKTGNSNLYQLKYYPNPVSTILNLKFSSSETGVLKMKIYDWKGKLVKTLVKEEGIVGGMDYQYQWELKNDLGYPVSNGTYLLRVDFLDKSDYFKVTVLR